MRPEPTHRLPRRRSPRRPALALLLLATLAALPGCAAVRRLADGYHDARRAAPEENGEGWLRASLAREAFDSALARVSSGRDAPADGLLRSLYSGTVAYYGGRYQESARAFVAADALADDRYTKSLTRGGLSLLSSDLVLPYGAGRTERLLVHYYGVVGYLKQDSAAAAAVEARRLSKLLESYGENRSLEETATHALLHYVAGVAFEAAGEREDARVAYRNAAALAGDSLAARALRSAERGVRGVPRPRNAAPTTGEVVVLVEQGFVGYRAQESTTVGLDSNEVEQLASTQPDTTLAALVARRLVDQAERPADAGAPSLPGEPHLPGAAPAPPVAFAGPHGAEASEAASVWTEVANSRGPQRRPGTPPYIDDTPARPAHHGPFRHRGRDRDATGYVLRIAWPTFVRPRPVPLPLGVIAAADSSTSAPLALRADLSDAAERDFERQRGALVARSIARAAAKYWATRAARSKGGRLGGAVANAATALLERADTRSWHLLPGTIGVARLTLPVGVHHVAVEVPSASGSTRLVRVGEVTVRPGSVTLLSTRLWRDGRPDGGVHAAPRLPPPERPRMVGVAMP